MVKDYLKGKNVEFEEKDIMVDAEARKELMKKGLRGVPVISIEGYKDIVGFDKQKLEQILG
ncbi:MAG: glutaredoxin family protein [Oscillospiraceae bacterium]|nr:glutaredoxin family protein [Oscillospiraceae bacterium]